MPLFPTVYTHLNFNGENLVVVNAKEKNTDEVHELITADPEAKKDAIYGYALGNHIEEVDALLKEDISLLPFAVAGYTRAGNAVKANALTAKNPDAKKQAVFGYAQAGNELQIQSALKSSPGFLLPAIEGCASTNQENLLLRLLRGTIYYPNAIQVAAKNGQGTLVNKLFEILGINHTSKFDLNISSSASLNQYSILNKALVGFVQGSNFVEAGHLINIGANAAHAITELSTRKDGFKEEEANILLAHINDDSVRRDTLEQILKINSDLKKSQFDLSQLAKLNELIQKGTNYLEAKNEVIPESIKTDVSLSGTLDISMLQELSKKAPSIMVQCM
ncbi:MAG: hypothetical protein ACRCXC_01525 [Legionella sp.]